MADSQSWHTRCIYELLVHFAAHDLNDNPLITFDFMKSVADIWKELQGATAPRGSGLGSLGGIPYTQRAQASRRPAKAPGPGFIGSLKPSAAAGEASEDAVTATLQRDINCLSDTDRRVRVKALESISAKLLGAAPAQASPQLLQRMLCGPLLIPLVRLLADPAEKCRELAAEFFQAAVGCIDDASGVLPTLLPALAERMGALPVEEQSEEMRLLLVQLLNGLVQRHAGPLLAGGGLLEAAVQVLCRGLEDSYPDIKKAACSALAQLAAGSSAAVRLEPHVDALLSSLLPNLQHQHSRVRLAALEALHALVTAGALQHHEHIEGRAAQAVQALVHDHAANVRVAFFASLARWMGYASGGATAAPGVGDLASRCRLCIPTFLPMLLLAITDESPAIRADALLQLEGVAAGYKPSQAGNGETDVMEVDEEEWVGSGQVVGLLPGYSHPFQERPSPSARAMVRSELPRLLPLVVKGSEEWTAILRASAARLLHAVLIYAEAGVLPHLPMVLQSLRAGVPDEDPSVASQANAACHVLGVNVPARHWAPFAMEGIAAEQLGTAQRAVGLQILAALLHAAAAAGQPAEQVTVQMLASVLIREDLVAADNLQLQARLVAATSALQRWAKGHCSAVALQLLHLLLHLAALEDPGNVAVPGGLQAAGGLALRAAGSGGAAASQQLTANGALEELAVACGLNTCQELCDQLAPSLLPIICEDQERWHSLSPNWRVFSSLLRGCSGAAMTAAAQPVLAVLQPLGISHDREPELRLAALALVNELLKDGSKAHAWQAGLGASLAQQVLLPALVWRAGKAAAAARYAVLTALGTMLHGKLLPDDSLLALVREAGLLHLLLQSLDEDYMSETRQVAVAALEQLMRSVGPALTPEDFASIQRELLRRLDDSSNPIRCAACGALLAYLSCRAAASPAQPLEPEKAGQLVSSVLVHMDDPDPAVQEAACSVLEAAARMAPDIVQERAAAVAGVHRSQSHIERVLAACDSSG